MDEEGITSGHVIYSPEDTYPILYNTVNYLTWYYMPVLITVGLLGNTLSLVVFLATHLSRLSLSVYLAALAISDSGFLISLLFGWMKYDGWAFFHFNGICQIVVFLSYVCSFLSVWFVVAFTVERYIAICHPLHQPEMCTVGRAKKVVIGLSIFASLVYLCNFWTTGVIYDDNTNLTTCTPFIEYYNTHVLLTYVDAIATLVVPFMAIIVFNVIIAHRIAYFYHKRQRLMSLTHYRNHNIRQCRAQIKVTKMLMVVSSVFIVTNLPSYVIRLRGFVLAFAEGHAHTSGLIHLIQKLMQFLYYSNFAVNFLLYSVASKKFRTAFFRLIRQLRHRLSVVTVWAASLKRASSTSARAIAQTRV